MRWSQPSNRGRRRPLGAGPPLLLAVAFLLLPLAAGAAPPQSPAHAGNARYVGDEACAACHSEVADSLAMTAHGDIRDFQAPWGQTGCEACHGPGSVHVETNDPADILNPATGDVVTTAQTCLSCHRNDHLDGFEMSSHALGNVTCTDCHEVHGKPSRDLLKTSEAMLCAGCHEDVQNRTALPSHHPIREGKMGCADCHDPHREGMQTDLAGERNNDLCFKCHSSHQGPYIFEHAPVVEDCAICHDPHGTVANNLLVENEPFLCLQCHQAHFHATLQGIEGEFTSIEGYTGESHRDSAKRSMLTKCTQCHSAVHGSDLPSQSISGQGRALTR